MIESDKILLAELVALKAKGSLLSPQQLEDWNRIVNRYPEAESLISSLFEKGEIQTPFDIRHIDTDHELNKFTAKLNRNRSNVRNIVFARYAAAAIVVFLLAGALWTWNQKNTKPDYIVADTKFGQKNDVLPGVPYAELAIGNQNRIELKNDAKYTELISAAKDNETHILSVPKRSTYTITLSDGTKVWVNPDSKLFYLAHFSKNERRIKLEGEAFFEVAKDPSRPFIVETHGMDIQAVGTAFNVKSYDAEPKVQLTEGKIKVRKNGQEIEISAGNEVLSKHGELETSKLDNPEEATAWKDGFFSFDGKGVAQILDELTRWYGIDVVYNGTLSQKRYEGGINKNSTLAQVCSALNDLTDYNFKIEGNKLLIENKK
jgi:hypothetical protein